MSIRIVPTEDDGRTVYAPRVFCDHCGQEITDAGRAMFAWPWDEARAGDSTAPLFLHKGPCAETAAPRETHGWDELERFPLFLAANIGADLERAKRSAQFMARL
ncbi:MAG: hypothetical protein LAO51_04515 [Acidobacteriia bacterium]|nr:hypothetical protein [Terriglobia bacterium]